MHRLSSKIRGAFTYIVIIGLNHYLKLLLDDVCGENRFMKRSSLVL